ncbi:acid phosphatase [Tsukamurella ocularis]|uniref:acid phosphatase n=1 Tax=Tsukamurella ocularis TaxID=1970234 RepID=UPI002168BABF|nr:phosphatase PAP2 family protein [Tsukamurella ocularis]MCS3779915.1 membrane-associated phospholipid phosphatase [Tsukamurella ocularis]MCS3788685.1 membrane-associated phospholipid phosphatase [Tsukamurella ocularis]MCS3849895.1 membrane-associated phospholipid phosphatase [Tsukamurella ocularis]
MKLRSKKILVATVAATSLITPLGWAAGPAVATPTAGCDLTPKAAPTAGPSIAAASTTQAAPNSYIDQLAAFSSLPKSVLTANLNTAVATNRAATAAEQRYAVSDNYDILDDSIFNALGSRLAQAFRAAEKAGELPNTTALLVGKKALINSYVDTSAAKKHFQYQRPFEVAPERITKYGDGRADLYESVRGSGSYPSGHTAWGYAEALVIATLLPELGPQLLARGADYGRHRVVLGVHYPLDVIGGRILAQAAVADALVDPRFAGVVAAARSELRAALSARAGGSIAQVVACQQNYVETGAAAAAYRRDLTWGLPRVGGDAPAQVPAGAVTLLRAAHPGLTDAQLRERIARTAGPAGYPLDVQGGWQRIDLLSAWIAR